MRSLIFIFILLIGGQQNVLQGQRHKIQQTINKFVKAELLSSSSMGIAITDLRNGKMIASYDPNRSLIPASSMKILTCAATMKTAGKQFSFVTPVYLARKDFENGVLHGDLIIQGMGDPSFGSYWLENNLSFEQFADSVFYLLRGLGITELNGQIRVNNDYIKDIPENPEWLWYDLGNYYGAGCFGFNFLENTAQISIEEPKTPNQVCEIVKVVPEALEEQFCSNVQATKEVVAKDLFVLGSTQADHYEVFGKIKCCGNGQVVLKAAIKNPAETFAAMLAAGLKKRGLLVTGSYQLKPYKSIELLWNYKSQNLEKLIKRTLDKSVNLYAESFLHLLGNLLNGTTVRADALKSMQKYWTDQGMDDEGVKLFDGSGLSPKNKMTAKAMSKVLYSIHKDSSLRDFHLSLQDVTKAGILSGRLSNVSSLSDRYRLKSGSMEGVRCFAGYILENGKPKYALVLMINSYSCSSTEIRNKIADFLIHLSSVI
ncbi:MAG TPA: D-alanyl-D-alanine carboxypeptidase/D-alanyl-D-alanine-endopeptidase [Saprospiraceae bacterium]|nr:D-alanyl-D-alanine carboxypeptidase/D-alanyl-D-alanine-endopeptidase [Saprospiraceae bacterium]